MDKDKKPTEDLSQQANDNDLDNGSDGTSDEITLESKTKIDELPEEYREKVEEIRKGFQRSYTKKAQTLAQKEKELAEKAKKGEEWEKWYSEHKPSIEAYNANLTDFSEYLKRKRDGVTDEIDHLKEDDTTDVTTKMINKALKRAEDVASDTSKFKEQASAYLKMSLRAQNLLLTKYRDLNGDYDKVLDYAGRRGITDMEEAIQGVYSKELKEAEFQKRLEEEKEKWQTQSNTNVLSANMPMGKTVRKVLARERGK